MRDIFVFGSNLAGRHGRGAALSARRLHGAEYGVGEGLTGDSYAIPTKDEDLRALPLSNIAESIDEFIIFAEGNIDMLFFVTPIGTGLAGHPIGRIANMFKAHKMSSNIVFTKEWFEHG